MKKTLLFLLINSYVIGAVGTWAYYDKINCLPVRSTSVYKDCTYARAYTGVLWPFYWTQQVFKGAVE